MHTSKYWIRHFKASAAEQRINWSLQPNITMKETATILHSLRVWQLGETSEGKQLTDMAARHGLKTGDPDYLEVTRLFIQEEQKHGNNLGRYLDSIGQSRIKQNWGDSIFRRVRHFNTNMEMLTVTVLIIESIAQVFYQALMEATTCALLKEICSDILIDEAHHITFQTERLATMLENKSDFSRSWRRMAYKPFFYATAIVVWQSHKKVFLAGGNTFSSYMKKLEFKYRNTFNRVTITQEMLWI